METRCIHHTGHIYSVQECERSASGLDNFTHHSMLEGRLTALSLMHINYDEDINMEEVVDILSHLHPWKLMLDNILLH